MLNTLLDEYLGDIATWNRNSEVFFWVKFKDYIDVNKIVSNNEGLTIADCRQFTCTEDNSVFISLTGIKQNDMHNAVKQLSYIARKSVKS